MLIVSAWPFFMIPSLFYVNGVVEVFGSGICENKTSRDQ